MTQKFKYYVTLAYLDTSEDDVKFEYIENQAYNAKDDVALAKKLYVTIWQCARIDRN